MTVKRDDMVMTPTLGPQSQPSAQVRARQERRIHGSIKKKGSLVRRIAKGRVAARTVRSAKRRVSASRVAKLARSGGTRAAGMMARAGSRAIATPVGAIVGAVIVAAVVGLRLASGQPLEGTGQQLNKMFLGDLDEQARATMATRDQITGDGDLTRIVARDGAVNAQITSISKDLTTQNKRLEDGATALKEAFPIDSNLDFLILRARDAFRKVWGGGEGKAAMLELQRVYGLWFFVASRDRSGR